MEQALLTDFMLRSGGDAAGISLFYSWHRQSCQVGSSGFFYFVFVLLKRRIFPCLWKFMQHFLLLIPSV